MVKPLAQYKILAIEDSPLILHFVSNILLAHGFGKVIFAENKRMALERLGLLDRKPYDLILLDRYLGEDCGIEILKTIRKRDKEVPIIMLTQEDEGQKVLEAITEGASDYIIKPFSAEVLLSKARKALGLPALQGF